MAARTVSGKFVRKYLAERPEKVVEHGKKVEGITPNDLFRNLKGRGRLHPENIRLFKSLVKGKYVYEVGTSDLKRVELIGPKGRKFVVNASDIRKFAGVEGKRGRLSNKAKAEYTATLV
jgi:hypothetical protein